LNPATGLRWAKRLADLCAAGQVMAIKDSMIAATALASGLTVATRNHRAFRKWERRWAIRLNDGADLESQTRPINSE